jgi:hypothetical protein
MFGRKREEEEDEEKERKLRTQRWVLIDISGEETTNESHNDDVIAIDVHRE